MAGKEFGVDVNPLAQELNTSLTLASQDTVPPEQESQLRAASKRLGIPLDSARTLPQETIKAGEQAAFDADDYAARFPTSAKYFADLNNARLSRDDVQPVANLEQSIRQFNMAGIGPSVMGQAVDAGAAMDANNPDKIRQDALAKFGFKGASIISRAVDKAQADAALPKMQAWDGKINEFTYGDAVRKGVGTVKLTWDFLADRLAGSLGLDQTETRRILAETSAYIDGLGKDFETELAFERAREGGGGSILGTIGALGSAVAQSDDPVGIVGKFMTEQLTASLPGAALGGVLAAPARAAATTYIRNELVAKGVSTALAGAAASATAVVTQSLGSNYKEGIDSGMLPAEAASRAWTKTLAEVPANAIAGAAIGLRIGPNALANVLAQTAIQGVGGGVGAASASLAVGEEIDPLEIALEVVGEAVGAAPDMVIAGATVPQEMQARADAQRRRADIEAQIAQVQNNAAQLQSVLAAAAASQTRVRDPESFNQLVQQAAEDSGTAPTELFIDAQPLVEILSQTGMTREQIEQMLPSVVEQLDEALATDGSVVIPVGEAVTAFAGTGFEQELVRNARVDADAISPADAEAAKASLQELDAEAQAIIAEQQEREAWEASAQRVFDDMNRDLNAAGRFTPDVNQVYATVVRDFYTVLAGKLGQMPDQVWARYRIPVTATGGRAGAALDQFAGAQDLSQVKQTETTLGTKFKTGESVTFWYVHNPQSATKLLGKPKKGDRYLRDFEPSAKYVTPLDREPEDRQDGYEYGQLTFNNPLVIENDGMGWKPQLSKAFGGKTGKRLSAAVIAAGYDGIVTVDQTRGGKYATETIDLTSFDVAKALYQSAAEPRDLFVGHNISAEGVRRALELGGLAAPSLGISRTTTGGFDGYGEITLLAPKEIIESSGARTFNADVYSPRQPRATYKIDSKKLYALADKADAMQMARYRGARRIDEDEVARYGAEALARADGVQMLYLDEIGELPKPKPKKVEPVIKKAAKLPGADRSYNLRDNPNFLELAKAYYDDQLAKLAEADPNRAYLYRKMFFDEDGSVSINSRDRLAREVQDYVESGGMDFPAYRDAIAKKLRTKAQSDAFSQWLQKQASEFITGKQLQVSPSRKIPYTLDNLVAQMTKELRGGEGFNYGAGNIRAMYAAEIGSVREVQNRREEIVSGEDFKRVKEESQQRLSDTLDALAKFYKYDASSWGYMNDASSALAEGPKGWRAAFRMTAESEKIIRDYVSYVKNLPTEYFEIKMQRAVGFNEFETAVVPKGAPQDVIDALTNAGLEIRVYDPNKPGSRAKAISGAKDLLFQSNPTPLPATIDIDGVQRSTVNSNGKQIAQTEEGVRNFWRWFGDSKVVDAQGRPLVVYHGTASDFEEFTRSVAGEFGSGYYAAASPEQAEKWGMRQTPMDQGYIPTGEGLNILPLFMAMRNPAAFKDVESAKKDIGVNWTPEQVTEVLVARGFDGVWSREDDELAAFTPTQIKSATGNRGTFDPNDPSTLNQPEQGGARAQFNPATLEISLLEKADLSSFLHELGHAFFEITAMVAAQPNAPQTLVDDMQTLFNATGYTGTLQEWLATPVSQRRIAHETVAESFEQYLIDGKAPSLELQSLFERMRTWMLRVYQTLQDFLSRNPNAKLTDEVRGVFDRMLATDEAIAAAKAARAALPLFTSAEQAGMTPEQFADYLRAAGEVDQDAIREVDSRSIRDMKWLRAARDRKLKELQKDAAAKRRNARIEARRQLLQEPVYRAMTFLRGKVETAPIEKRVGKTLDPRRDDLVTAIARLGGLNKEAAVAEFGIDPADFQTKIVGNPTLRAGKAGKSPDAMAEALAELGYLQPREAGRYDLRDLGDLLHEAARGVPSYSLQADYDLIYGYKTLPVPGDASENPFGAGRLSLPELTERFAGTDVDFMKLGVGRRGMIAEIGMPMDAVAEIVGFKTGEEMVRALLDAEPLQSATEGLTDQIMLERYGDLASDDAIERAADAALANDARTRMVATEFAALNTAVGSVRAVQNAARQTAGTVVARQKIRNVRPDKSAAAVARAGKGAEAALRKGDRDTAAGFKRSQVLNAAIEREQRKVRTEIDKAIDNIRAMFGNDKTVAKSRDMNLVNAAREAVARYGLAPEVAGQRADNYMNVLARENPEMADQLEAITDMLPEPKPYRDLTVEEFRSLRDSVLGLYQLARRVMQTRIDGKLVDIDEVATPIVEAVINRNGGELPGLLGYDGTVTDAEKMKNALLGFKAAGMRVEQWADAMGAEVKRIIYQQVSDAAVQARLVRTDLIKRYRDLIKLIEPGMSYDPINAPELGTNGFVFHRGKQELLHALLHTGNASNLRKLLLGRGWADLDAEGNLDTARWDSFLRRMVDEGVVTKADYDFAQGVWDLLESVKKDAQKAHFDIYGFYFNEVTADEIETPFGTYRGGYVPALVDPLSAADQQQKRDAEAAAQGGNSYMFPTTGKGFTQARVEYNRPLMLDLRTIASHLDKVTRFTYLEPAIKDAGRLMMNKRVARALNGLDNNLIGKMINPWLQRTAQQTTTVPTRFPKMDQFFRAIRTRSGLYILFANVINTMQQLTGFSVAAVKVPAPKLLRALKSYIGNPREMTRMAMELSPWLRDRLDRQGFEMTQQIEEILVNPSLYRQSQDFMKRHAYFMQTGLQNVMDVVVWWGAYDQARSTKGVTDKQAVRFADEVIRTTQGTYSPEDVSGIEVLPAFYQLFTQFWGYFNMLANTLGGEVGKTLREMGYMASTPRLLGIWFLGLMIPAFVGQLIAQGAPDDEDDEDGDGTLDEWLAMFFGSQASTLAAMVPVVGQLSMGLANQFDSKIYNDRLNISPAISFGESALAGASEILQGEAFDDRLKKSEVRNVAILVALATGMPTNVIAKPLGYELDVQAGKKDPDNAAEYAIGLATGR